MKSLRIAAVPVILSLFGIPAVVSAGAQTTLSAADAIPLHPYTAPDKSVSAGVPYGWQVINAGSGAIAMEGPENESVNVEVVVAYDGPFQLGQKGPGGAGLTMPSSARLSDKLLMVFEQEAALSAKPAPQLKYLYQAPIKMPSGMGQCGMFAISAGGSNPSDALGIFCSLGDSPQKFFKTFLMYGAAPTFYAAQNVTIVEAVLESYKLAPGWTQKILSPYAPADSADPGPGGSGYPSGANASANPGPGAGGYPSNPPTANSSKTAMDDGPGLGGGYNPGPGLGGGYNPGPGGSAGYPNNPPTANNSKTAMDDGPGLGGGYNPGPGGSGYPNNPPAANSSKTAMDDGPGLGGGYNPGPGGSAGYPNNPPTANSSKTAMDDGPGLGGGYNPGPGLGGGYNPGPGGSAGYPYDGTDPSASYSEVLLRNHQAIDHGFACVDANIVGSGSRPQTPVECGGWKPNF
jgi:hypothetical protein